MRRVVVQATVRPVVVAVDVGADLVPGLLEGLELLAPDAAELELSEPGLDERLGLGVAVAAAPVGIANTRRLPQISKAKAKTDRLDARMLGRLASTRFLKTVGAPDEFTRALRRLCARRETLL